MILFTGPKGDNPCSVLPHLNKVLVVEVPLMPVWGEIISADKRRDSAWGKWNDCKVSVYLMVSNGSCLLAECNFATWWTHHTFPPISILQWWHVYLLFVFWYSCTLKKCLHRVSWLESDVCSFQKCELTARLQDSRSAIQEKSWQSASWQSMTCCKPLTNDEPMPATAHLTLDVYFNRFATLFLISTRDCKILFNLIHWEVHNKMPLLSCWWLLFNRSIKVTSGMVQKKPPQLEYMLWNVQFNTCI